MKPGTAARLLALNREFYERFGDSFSATRRRLQPGVKRILEALEGDESILDLGCGSGELARELGRRGHRGAYLGLDFSPPLLREAQSRAAGFPAGFLEADLARLSEAREPLPTDRAWDLVTMFATLHHIPSHELRSNLLETVRTWIGPGGRLVLSNWQFLNSRKLKARIQPWSRAGLSPQEVDEGDYLLDWRRGGEGLRYVHHFSAAELSALAKGAGLRVSESFSSDGEAGRLGLYQVWSPAE